MPRLRDPRYALADQPRTSGCSACRGAAFHNAALRIGVKARFWFTGSFDGVRIVLRRKHAQTY